MRLDRKVKFFYFNINKFFFQVFWGPALGRTALAQNNVFLSKEKNLKFLKGYFAKTKEKFNRFRNFFS